jgi:hypothetical protein
MSWSSKANAERLRVVAAEQGGFFTATQAKEAGYDDAVHGYHVSNGDWQKACRGVYRLASEPVTDWPELIIWSLWSRDRDGKPQGVYSHDTADMIHGTIPKTEGPLHMTVPRSFRKNCEIPTHLILHKEDLDPAQIEYRGGYAVVRRTAPLRAHYDRVINAGED